MYFLFHDHFSLTQIVEKALEIFGTSFTEKLFREQLSFFGDISYEETIEYLVAHPSEIEIKAFLTEKALEPF